MSTVNFRRRAWRRNSLHRRFSEAAPCCLDFRFVAEVVVGVVGAVGFVMVFVVQEPVECKPPGLVPVVLASDWLLLFLSVNRHQERQPLAPQVLDLVL